MKILYVIYDDRCGVCSQARVWLERQPAYVALRLIPSGSPALAQLFPDLPATLTGEEVVAVSDLGEVYRGAKAWITILWALRDYRGLSRRLANPALLPLARQAFQFITAGRHAVSQWLGFLSDEELRRTLSVPESQASWTPCRLKD